MSYEAKPVNVNKGGVSRSGFTSGTYQTDRHPTDPAFDMRWWGYVIAPAIVVLAVVAV